MATRKKRSGRKHARKPAKKAKGKRMCIHVPAGKKIKLVNRKRAKR